MSRVSEWEPTPNPSSSDEFLQKGVLKISRKITGEHPFLVRDFNKAAKQLY